jgi:hypothetical protein
MGRRYPLSCALPGLLGVGTGVLRTEEGIALVEAKEGTVTTAVDSKEGKGTIYLQPIIRWDVSWRWQEGGLICVDEGARRN